MAIDVTKAKRETLEELAFAVLTDMGGPWGVESRERAVAKLRSECAPLRTDGERNADVVALLGSVASQDRDWECPCKLQRAQRVRLKELMSEPTRPEPSRDQRDRIVKLAREDHVPGENHRPFSDIDNEIRACFAEETRPDPAPEPDNSRAVARIAKDILEDLYNSSELANAKGFKERIDAWFITFEQHVIGPAPEPVPELELLRKFKAHVLDMVTSEEHDGLQACVAIAEWHDDHFPKDDRVWLIVASEAAKAPERMTEAERAACEIAGLLFGDKLHLCWGKSESRREPWNFAAEVHDLGALRRASDKYRDAVRDERRKQPAPEPAPPDDAAALRRAAETGALK